MSDTTWPGIRTQNANIQKGQRQAQMSLNLVAAKTSMREDFSSSDQLLVDERPAKDTVTDDLRHDHVDVDDAGAPPTKVNLANRKSLLLRLSSAFHDEDVCYSGELSEQLDSCSSSSSPAAGNDSEKLTIRDLDCVTPTLGRRNCYVEVSRCACGCV